jgi:hypothetical protein
MPGRGVAVARGVGETAGVGKIPPVGAAVVWAGTVLTMTGVAVTCAPAPVVAVDETVVWSGVLVEVREAVAEDRVRVRVLGSSPQADNSKLLNRTIVSSPPGYLNFI